MKRKEQDSGGSFMGRIFGKLFRRQEPEAVEVPEVPEAPKAPVMTVGEALRNAMKEDFEAHDSKVQVRGRWLEIDGGRLMASVSGEIDQAPTPVIKARADYVFRLPGGQEIREALIGLGDTQAAAMNQLARNFLDGVFHVVAATFLDHGCDHYDRDDWRINGAYRQVNMGWAVMRGRFPRDSWEAIYEALRGTIEQHGIPDGVHWLRLFFLQQSGGEPIVEVLLDNQKVPELEERVRHFPWKPADDFYSVRLFMIFPAPDK